MMVSIITGTNRKDSNSAVYGEELKRLLANSGTPCRMLNLTDLPENFVFANEVYDRPGDDMKNIAKDFVEDAERFIFVIPEYNGSFPGALKAFIDSVFPSRIRGKKALLVGIASGRAGNLRGLEHFTGVLNYLNVAVMPFKPTIPHVEATLNEDMTELMDEKVRALLEKAVGEFLKF
jgi:chromate reductase